MDCKLFPVVSVSVYHTSTGHYKGDPKGVATFLSEILGCVFSGVVATALIIEYDIFGEGFQISTNQKRETNIFSLQVFETVRFVKSSSGGSKEFQEEVNYKCKEYAKDAATVNLRLLTKFYDENNKL